MPTPQYFTFCDADIAKYTPEEELYHFLTFSDKEIKTHKEEEKSLTEVKETKYNLDVILGNFTNEQLDIIACYTNAEFVVDWESLSKNEELDDSFIYKYADKLFWPYLVKYQKLSKGIIEHFLEKIIKEKLLMSVIINQKLSYNVINNLYGNMKYWELLVIYQILGKTTLYKMINYKNSYENEKEVQRFNKLIIKHQLTKENTHKII